MKKIKHLPKLLAGILSTAFFMSFITGCSKTPELTKEIQLKTNATLGNILTDKEGRTLYFFANDATSASACTGNCELIWPAFNVDNRKDD